jgi:hypothetical protein
MSTPHSEVVRRAALPELLFVPDVALSLQVTRATARRAIVRGRCGPYTRVGRRYCLRRETFLEAIAGGETRSTPNLELVQVKAGVNRG